MPAVAASYLIVSAFLYACSKKASHATDEAEPSVIEHGAAQAA